MAEGGMIELWLPSEMGYAARRKPGIPPDSNLHFVVELRAIEPRSQPGSTRTDAPQKESEEGGDKQSEEPAAE